jgi:hypothetical protein
VPDVLLSAAAEAAVAAGPPETEPHYNSTSRPSGQGTASAAVELEEIACNLRAWGELGRVSSLLCETTGLTICFSAGDCRQRRGMAARHNRKADGCR